MSQEALDEFHEELYDLLPWQDSSSESAASIEAESFMSMMQGQQG